MPTLDELFNEDPLNLSDQDLDVIIAAFREQRKKWVEEETSAKASGRRPKPPALPPPAAGTLSLDDLKLDL